MTARFYVYATLALTLGLILVRLALTLGHDGFLGIDMGAYLLHAKRLMGYPAPQVDFQRAPLGPGYLLVPFLWAFGDDIGSKVWTSIFSVVPLLPAAALLAHRLLPRHQALLVVALLTINPWNWEQVVTGALPAIGIGLILLALWGLIPVMEGKGARWDKVAVAGAIGIIPYINHTSTGLAAVALPVFMGGALLLARSWRPLLNSLRSIWTGCLLALPALLFFYGDVAFGSSRISYPGPKLFVPVGYTAAWLIFFYALPVAWYFLSRKSKPALTTLALTLLAYGVLGMFSSYDEAIINILYRSQYIGAALLVLLGVPYVAGHLARQRKAQVIAGAVIGAFMLGGSAYAWYAQPIFSDIMTPDMVAVAQQIPSEYRGSVLVNSFPMGMWLSATEARPTKWLFKAKPPSMYTGEYALSQCVVGWTNGCDPSSSATALGVRYLLLDTRPPFSREPNYWGAPPRDSLWLPVKTAPWLRLVASQGAFRLWEVIG